jgi:hypothetical protein
VAAPHLLSGYPLAMESKTLLVCIPLFFFGTGILFFFGSIKPLIDVYKSKRWSTVKGKVVSVSITGEFFDSGYLYTPQIKYEYIVNGRRYLTHRFSFSGMRGTIFRKNAERRIQGYEGAEVVVHYNPQAPENAVLYTEIDWSITIAGIVIGSIISYVGFSMLLL